MRSHPNDPVTGRPELRPPLTRDVDRILAVVAHPDDESFALGALLDRFTSCGIPVTLLCFTHGEASTLHGRAGDLATVRATGRTVLAWTLPREVAERLNDQFGTAFVGRTPDEIDTQLSVSRTRQHRAITAHPSQSLHNPVLSRRLALLRDREHLRVLHHPEEGTTPVSYAYTARLTKPFSPAIVDRVRAALKEQGFGVLTEIDIQATLRAKLDVTMEEYVILGACNPPLAHRALGIDPEIGLLLPCNVVVRADGPDACLVQALDPQTMVQITGRPELKPVADDAAGRLRAALNQLGS